MVSGAEAICTTNPDPQYTPHGRRTILCLSGVTVEQLSTRDGFGSCVGFGKVMLFSLNISLLSPFLVHEMSFAGKHGYSIGDFVESNQYF